MQHEEFCATLSSGTKFSKPLFYLSNSLFDLLIDFFSVADAEYPNFILDDLKDHPIITDAKLPVSLQRLSQGLSVLMRSYSKTALNSRLDPPLKPFIK